MIRLAIITNIPAPYRIPIYQIISNKLGFENFHIIYCAKKEANRDWKLSLNGFSHSFLKERSFEKNGKYIHNNPDVWSELNRLNPEVVITTGFNPTHLYAFFWAFIHRKKHIAKTDGTFDSEKVLHFFHRLIRRVVYNYSNAFIGTCLGSKKLFESYGVSSTQFFQSHLCANNDAFLNHSSIHRAYDFMFSGRFSSEKNPIFALDVAIGVAKIIGRKVSILFLGSGPLGAGVKQYAECHKNLINATFKGFIQQDILPEHYSSSKVFLFPSSWDPWGVVANEACAAGQAVLVSPHAGVAGELVINNENGFVIPLELNLWVDKAVELITNDEKLAAFSRKGIEMVKFYSYENAADGVIDAYNFVTRNTKLSILGSKQSGNILQQKKLKEVVIVQRRLCDYRVAFFEQLKKTLAEDNINLRLLYGCATKLEQQKNDAGYLGWAEFLRTKYFFKGKLCWQPYNKRIKNADLVIVTHENKLINNLCPIFSHHRYKLAFWGHAQNYQTEDNLWFKLKELFKRTATVKVDWWFSYTEKCLNVLKGFGFTEQKITITQNAIDANKLQAQLNEITQADVDAFKVKIDLKSGYVGIYMGSLFKDKRLEFLIESSKEIIKQIPEFKLLIVGNGEENKLIKDAALKYSWIIHFDRAIDKEKALLLKASDVMLNPGMVGLSILDCFNAGIPMITTDCDIHSPEIAYLKSGENGLITANTLNDYVNGVVSILRSERTMSKLKSGCLASSKVYTLENMVNNFKMGILQALEV